VISLFFVSSWYDSLVPINLLGVGSRKSFGLCLSVYGIMFVSFVSELCLIKFQLRRKKKIAVSDAYIFFNIYSISE